jgi:hypothetical protein
MSAFIGQSGFLISKGYLEIKWLMSERIILIYISSHQKLYFVNSV